MSMDLYLCKAPVTDDPDEAAALIDRYFDDRDETVFEPSGDIAAAAAKLRVRYSDDPTDIADDDCPWSSLPFEQTDRLLVLNIRWGADNAVLDYIVELGREHDLVIYDPQGPSVYLPSDPVDQEPVLPPTFTDHFKIWGMALGFVALTYGAWQIPWGWLRWPAVIVAGFLTISSFIVVYAMLTEGGDETA